MKKRFLGIAAIAALSFCVGSLWGHHTTEVYFDLNTTYLLKGVITSVAWRNPHAYAFMDVTTCKKDNWAVELGSLPAMTRAGFSRDTLQKGMPISIYASPAKFASNAGLPEVDAAWKDKHFVLGGCMTLPDGKQIEYEDGPRCKRPAQDIVIGTESK
ncbi:MAG TPA: DUF6152 family protein [Terriglobia bacterium]|nr:DUF6152 family protein [Terriglobia bacterium]